jgi:dTDP-4-dehydrorhamnose reductase
MRILVAGVSGMLGSNIAAAAVQQSWDVLGLWHATPAQVQGASALALDVADRSACVAAASGFEPDVLVHCAIVGDPGRFERDPGQARNARVGIEHTLAAARAVRARYVLVSCDWVFSGLRPPRERWEETDVTEPVNAYGRALLAAEELVRAESDVRWLIVRVGDPYGVNLSVPFGPPGMALGHGARGHGEPRELSAARRHGALVRHVWERSGEVVRVVARLRDGDPRPLPAPADVQRSPTYAWDFAQRLCELIAQDREGVYHLAGPDSVHRREFLRMVAHAFGCVPTLVLDGDLEAYLRALGEPPELVLPPNTTLDCARASAALEHAAVDVEAGLWLMSDQLRRVLAR